MSIIVRAIYHVILTQTTWMQIAVYVWIIQFSVDQRHAVPDCFDIRSHKPKPMNE